MMGLNPRSKNKPGARADLRQVGDKNAKHPKDTYISTPYTIKDTIPEMFHVEQARLIPLIDKHRAKVNLPCLETPPLRSYFVNGAANTSYTFEVPPNMKFVRFTSGSNTVLGVSFAAPVDFAPPVGQYVEGVFVAVPGVYYLCEGRFQIHCGVVAAAKFSIAFYNEV